MPRFLKHTLTPGNYLVTDENGNRKVEHFSPERIVKQAETVKAMREAGLNIPVPWSHEGWATPETKKTSIAERTKFNAGFVEVPEVNKKGELGLWLDIPLEEDARRMGTIVREVSPYIRKKWTDGNGREWDDAILHVALVTNPIMPGQKNFVAAEDQLAIAMSHFLPEGIDLASFGMSGDGATLQNGSVPPPTTVSSANPSIGDVLTVLDQIGLKLPSDTTDETLKSAIVTAGTAVIAATKGDDDDGILKPGERTSSPPTGVALAHPDGALKVTTEAKFNAALATATNLQKGNYRDRINALVHARVTTKAFADQRLFPQVEAFAMSFDDSGNQIPANLDAVLESLEAVAAESGANRPTSRNPFAPAGTPSDGTALGHYERAHDVPADDDGSNPFSLANAKKQADALQTKLLAQVESRRRA